LGYVSFVKKMAYFCSQNKHIMHIQSLHIQNFRIFEDFRLEGLKRVNLFAGKNNTGKTAILEALRLYMAPSEDSVYISILANRGQYSGNINSDWSSFFNRRTTGKTGDTFFRINGRLEFQRKEQPNIPSPQFHLFWDGTEYPYFMSNANGKSANTNPQDVAVFLPFGGEKAFPLFKFWDKIALTPLEDDVVSILRDTILPDIVRFDINQERTLVRLKSEPNPIPLKNLGDGAQRMLQMAIALVSARDNILLIDEIESGLHYTVIEKLWQIIFEYAPKWNIQVFATTHSYDTVKTFTYLLEEDAQKDVGAFFRLQPVRGGDQIVAVPLTFEELELSISSNLEPR